MIKMTTIAASSVFLLSSLFVPITSAQEKGYDNCDDDELESQLEDLLNVEITTAGKDRVKKSCHALVDVVFNDAEENYADLLGGVAETQLAFAAESKWAYRYWSESGIYAAYNFSDQGVYVLGGEYGPTPVFIDFLSNLLQQVPSGILNPGTGACIVPVLPGEGTVVDIQFTEFDENGVPQPSTTTAVDEYIKVTPTEVQVDSTLTIINGELTQTITSSTKNLFQISNDIRYATVTEAESTISTTGFADFSQTVTTQYTPALYSAPNDCLRVGMTWYSAPVQLTLATTYSDSRPDTLVTSTTEAFVATVTSTSTPSGELDTFETLEVTQHRVALQYTDKASGHIVGGFSFGENFQLELAGDFSDRTDIAAVSAVVRF